MGLENVVSFVGGALNTLAGPMGSAIDIAGSALKLPPLITNTAKVVAGLATGNVMLAAGGAAGVAQELINNPPGRTEYTPPRNEAAASAGYAKPSGKSHLDPKLVDYVDALKTLEQNFPYLEKLGSGRDGTLSQGDVRNLATNPQVSPELRKAAQFLVDNGGYFERLESSTSVLSPLMQLSPLAVAFDLAANGSNDDRFTLANLRNEIFKVEEDFARYGRPQRAGEASSGPKAEPPKTEGEVRPRAPTAGEPRRTVDGARGTGSTGGTKEPSEPTETRRPSSPSRRTQAGNPFQSGVRDILNNPNMSLEQKLQMVLMALTKDVDGEMLKVMDDLAAAQDERANIDTKDDKSKKKLVDADRKIEFIQLRLQQLMEKRKMMFDMMSNMSAKFNEMAKTALSNLRSA